MNVLVEKVGAHVTDARIIFTVASIFGFCVCKLLTKAQRSLKRDYKKEISRSSDNSDESDDDAESTEGAEPLYYSDNQKLVLVIVSELAMGKGKIAAQCGHASVAAYKSAAKHPKLLRAWEECGQPKITLKVQTENDLLALAAKAKLKGLLTNVIRDAGHTQVRPGSITVCAIGPGPATSIDDVTGHLKLF